MTPEQLQQARHTLGLNLTDMARMLGYTGQHARAQMHDLETGRRPLMDAQRRLLQAYLDGYRPRDWPMPTK